MFSPSPLVVCCCRHVGHVVLLSSLGGGSGGRLEPLFDIPGVGSSDGNGSDLVVVSRSVHVV